MSARAKACTCGGIVGTGAAGRVTVSERHGGMFRFPTEARASSQCVRSAFVYLGLIMCLRLSLSFLSCPFVLYVSVHIIVERFVGENTVG